MKLIGALLVNTLALLVTAYLVPGFVVSSLSTALVAAIVIGVINMFIKPVLQLVALPITFLTLGLFALILNVLLLMLAAQITPGFDIDNFFSAVIGSIVLSLTSSFLGLLTR